MSRQRAFRGTLGSGGELLVRQVVQFAAVLILARVLTPADFGVVAILVLLVGVGMVLADAGLTTVILQRTTLDRPDADTAFGLSLVIGAGVTIVAALLSWPLAAVFGLSAYASLAAFMSLSIVATAIGQVPAALLAKRLAFGRLLVVGAISTSVSGTLAIALAIKGAGPWALAVQGVTTPALRSALLLTLAPDRPKPRWSNSRAKDLLARGRWVLFANLVDVGFLRVQYAAIGRLFGPTALGNYERADTTQQLVNDSAANVVGRVALPIFSESAGDPTLLGAGFKTGVRITTTFTAPVMAVLSALSGPVLMVAFGPQWTAAAQLLSVLALAGMVWPFHMMAINVLYAAGENRLVFRIDLVKKAIAVLLLVIGGSISLLGLAVAQLVFAVVAVGINGWAVRRVTGLPLATQTREAMGPTALALLMGAAVTAAYRCIPLGSGTSVLIFGGLGLLGYFAVAAATRMQGLRDVIALLPRSAGRPRG